MITESLKQQFKFKKLFTWGNIILKTADGVYTWYSEVKLYISKIPI